MDRNERKIVQELVTVLGCVIPASDGYEPRTNLWNKYTAAKNLLAAAPQVVADERAHEIMNSMAVHVDDWADGLDYEPSKTEVSGKALHYILSRVAAPVQAQEPVAGTAVEAVLLSDMVEGSHPQYGNGLFATENCVTTLYRAPVQPVAVPGILTDEKLVRAAYEIFGIVADDTEIMEFVRFVHAAAPVAQGDAKDAERWREVLMHVGATVTGDIGARFTLRFLEQVEGTDLMRGGVAGHFTDAIDAAIAAKAAS